MGMIKTAIITGGGVYAVNKLANAAERRHSSSHDYEQREHSQTEYPRRSRTPPQYQTYDQARTIEGSGPESNAPPGYWYSAEHNAYYPVPRAQPGDTSKKATLSSQRGYQYHGPVNEQLVYPPAYSSQYQTEYASTPSQRSEHAQGASPGFFRGDFAGQAIDYIIHAADGNKRNS